MAAKRRSKAKLQRRFGIVLMPRPKYLKIVNKRPYPPGEHGQEQQYRARKKSNYGRQLDEKQKLAFIYDITDKQIRKYFEISKRLPGITGHNLLILLEQRLDTVVYRAGFAVTIWAAGQLVTHGHILVDGRKVDIRKFEVKPGQTITIAEKMKRNPHVLVSLKEATGNLRYITVDRETATAHFISRPTRDEIPVPINEQLIVEYYTRLT